MSEVNYRRNGMKYSTSGKCWGMAPKAGDLPKEYLEKFVLCLAPFAPHLGEELWQCQRGGPSALDARPSTSLAYVPWPVYDAAALVEDEIEIPV